MAEPAPEPALECPNCYERFEVDGNKAPLQFAQCCGAVACRACIAEARDDGEVCCHACFQTHVCTASLREFPVAEHVVRRLIDERYTEAAAGDGGDGDPRPSSLSAYGDDGLPRSSLSAFLDSAPAAGGPRSRPSSLSAFLGATAAAGAVAPLKRHVLPPRPQSLDRGLVDLRASSIMRVRRSAGGSHVENAVARMSAVRLSTDFDPDLARCRAFFEAGKLLPLSEVLALLTAARLLLEAEANVLRLEEPVLVVGDIHGQFADLMTILHGGAVCDARQSVGLPADLDDSSCPPPKAKSWYSSAASPDGGLVFLGDYVDRGARGCEVLLYLLLLKLRYPDRVHLLRGNHECRALTGHFGFRAECRSKYGLTVYHECCRVFEALPLAAVVARRRGDVLCCHGGLGPSFDTVGDLEQVDRRAEPLEAGVLCDVLWADPGRDRAFDGVLYEDNDKRGCSVFFGREATLQFLARNGLAAIVRAHEVQEVGSRSDFGPPLPRRGGLFGGYASTKGALAPVTTVFSAPNYCGRYGNTAAVLRIGDRDSEFYSFDAADDAADQGDGVAHQAGEAEQVRWAYGVCPYMPATFRALVQRCGELGKAWESGAAAPKRPAETTPGRARTPSAAGRENVPPPPLGASLSTPVKPTERRWSTAGSMATKEASPRSDAFAAALHEDEVNEMDPRELRRGHSLHPRAQPRFTDSRSKRTITQGLTTVGSVKDDELQQIRAELRSARSFTVQHKRRETIAMARQCAASPETGIRARAASPEPGVRARAAPDGGSFDATVHAFSDDEIHALRLIFSFFDVDGSDHISRSELATYAEELENCTVADGDIDVCMAALDADNDGVIDLNDWTAFAARLRAAHELQGPVPSSPGGPTSHAAPTESD